MTSLATLQQHYQVCDDLHQLALEENRFLRQHQRPPSPPVLERKRSLLEKLEASLVVLRSLPAASVRDPDTRRQLEDSRARILQILQLDKENEQLLLRCSLTGGRPNPAVPTSPSVSMLQRIYARCT